MPFRRSLLAATTAALAAPRPARAQGAGAWPRGPIRIVAPFPPGGSVDTLARLLQQPLQAELGVPIVVENRGGASGSIGTAAVARSAPDGQTFVLVFDTHAVNPFLISSMGFDTRRDLAPVMLIGTAPMVLCVRRDDPRPDFAAVLAEARARPDALAYGTIGNGSLAHLTMTLAQEVGGFRVTHVPYRGGGPLIAAALGGEVPLSFATPTGLGGNVGTALRPLVQTGAVRSPAFPAVPTLEEAGLPGVAASAFWGLLAPAGVPAPVIERMHAALMRITAAPGFRQKLVESQGVEVVASTPAEFGTFLDAQMDRWGRLVREKNIRAD